MSEVPQPKTLPQITDVPHTDVETLMNPGLEKRQALAGFDEDYVDIVDYIVRCTHKIWEGRDLGLIYSHYAHNVLIQHLGRSDDGAGQGHRGQR